jgi:mRNA-degrading endonuclease HigB of HigAB toxin-antitoxin module
MRNIIVLDIGTQFIKASVSGNDKFFIQEDYIKNAFLSCEKIIKKITKKSKIKSREILLGLNSEILNGKATTLCFKRERPQEQIDLIELKNLIQKIEWKALDNIKQEFLKETELKDSDVKLINAYLIDIKIDGHSNLNPVGVSGENICINVYNTYTSVQKLNYLDKFISDSKLRLIEMIPVSFALFGYLELEKQQKSNTLIIDIGSRITEMTLVKNGGETIETKSFHLGGRAFSRVLAEFLNSNEKTGELIKMKYADGEISVEATKKIEKLFTPNISSWFSGVKIILNDFLKNHKFIPDKIYICGGGSKIPLIKSCFKKERKIKVLDIGDKKSFLKISCLALQKFYLSRPNEKNVFVPIFKRVIKLIQNQ